MIKKSIFSLTVLLWSLLVLGSSFEYRPLPQTVKEAPLLIKGRVFSVDVRRVNNHEKETNGVYTFTSIEIEEVLKGELSVKNVTVRQIGGTLDGVQMRLEGVAEFRRGESVVLLLGKPHEDGSYPVKGMMMGKYQVKEDQNGEEYIEGPGLITPEGVSVNENDTVQNKKVTIMDLKKIISDQASGITSEVLEQKNVAKNEQKNSPTVQNLEKDSTTNAQSRAGNETEQEEGAYVSKSEISKPAFTNIVLWITAVFILLGASLFLIFRITKR